MFKDIKTNMFNPTLTFTRYLKTRFMFKGTMSIMMMITLMLIVFCNLMMLVCCTVKGLWSFLLIC